MMETETEAVEVQLLKPGWVHEGIAREKGERIRVDRETFGRLLGMGFCKGRIRVRALQSNVLATNRVLALDEVGEAVSEQVALEGHRLGIWEIENPSALHSALPFRPDRRRVRVRVVASSFANGDWDRQTRLPVVYRQGDTCLVEVGALARLLRGGLVERLEGEKPQERRFVRVRVLRSGWISDPISQIGESCRCAGEICLVDSDELPRLLRGGLVERLGGEGSPAAGDSGSPAERKTSKGPK
jgi:hypothetical protein